MNAHDAVSPTGVSKLSFKEIRENQRTVVEGRLVVEIFLWLGRQAQREA